MLHNKATIEQYLSRAGKLLGREEEEDFVSSAWEAWATKKIIISLQEAPSQVKALMAYKTIWKLNKKTDQTIISHLI